MYKLLDTVVVKKYPNTYIYIYTHTHTYIYIYKYNSKSIRISDTNIMGHR